MKPFEKITIVGVGLLGGSIGLAVKKYKLAKKVTGFFRHKAKIRPALVLGAIDEGTDRFDLAVKDSDLIILCSPVSDIVDRLRKMKSKALITDTGSTKVEINRAGRRLRFIGSHPLAGSERSGASFARADLFRGSLCILTPEKKDLSSDSLSILRRFWQALGAKVVILTPQDHDAALGFTSHLPHAIAFSLIQTVPDAVLRLSAGGLRDTTRIALSSPDLWADIFVSNKINMLRSIGAFKRSLGLLETALKQSDKNGIRSYLAKAQKKRMDLSSNI